MDTGGEGGAAVTKFPTKIFSYRSMRRERGKEWGGGIPS